MSNIDLFKVGDKFEYSFGVTESTYLHFQEMTSDKNPLHVDEEFAKQKGFRERVMYGNILNGFVSYFIGMGLPSKDVMLLSQSINWKKPVYMNDKVDFEAKVSEVSEAVSMVEFKYKFRNQDKVLVASGNIQIKVF